MVGAAPEPDAKPPSAGEVGALRTKLATLSAINGALRDENDELRRAVEEASDAGGTAGSDVERRLADAEETVASLTRQRDELEAHLLDRSEDDSEASSRLADAKRRNRDREKELERAAREIGTLLGERRKLELATADARRERGAAEQKLVRAEENARFARERHEAEARDAEALLEDLRRRLTRSERDAKAERASLLTQLEAAQSATAAALGEEAQTAVADAEAAEAAAAEAAEAAANEIRGAESRARDAESGGASFDEALASAVAETARAAEQNRRDLARARTELANESRSRARLEKELEEDRKQSSAKIEELTRESRQGSMERQAALSAVRDRASAAEADATRAEARVVELTDAAAELARALDAEREENAERDRSAAALASGVDALRAELEETRARLERLTDERDRAREEAAEARVEANERNAALGRTNRSHPDRDVRSDDGSADRPPMVSPSRVDDKARVTKRDTIHAFGGGGFDVSALVESGRNERARRTDAMIRAAVRDVEAKHAEESAKRDAELADARERAESAESALAVLAADASDASDAESSPARRRAAIDAASANLERHREEARAAIASRAALAEDHATLLEMLGEKTETCDVLETSLRLATERLERRDATDARFDVSRRSGFNSGGGGGSSLRKTTRPSRRDAYVATLTHAVFVARGGSDLEPADD